MQFLVLRGIPIKCDTTPLYIEQPKEELYTVIPKIYDEKTWPISSNLPCYMCTITTKRKPFFVPSIITSDNIIHRGMNPVVCSPSCAMSWIMEKSNDESEKRRYTAYVLTLLQAMTGIMINVVECSPDRSELLKYGGRQTDHEYQRELIISAGYYMRNLYSSQQDYETDLS